MSVNSKMTAIADEIRELSGTSGAMGLDAMATNIGDANGEVSTQTDLLAQIVSALEGKAAGGSSEPVLQTKTVTPTTSQQVITPDSGYDGLSNVTVNAMPTATQATPSVSIDSAGKITATATQTAGYVAAGTKTGTKQLTTQAAQTITPSTSDKTIASGRYLTGTQTIKGDANLVAGNIKSGVSIFGVAGSYEGSGGGGAVETCTGRVVYTDMLNFRNPFTPPCYYTGDDLSTKTFNAHGGGTGITAIKGSLLYVADTQGGTVSKYENATLVLSTSTGKLFSIDADEFRVFIDL